MKDHIKTIQAILKPFYTSKSFVDFLIFGTLVHVKNNLETDNYPEIFAALFDLSIACGLYDEAIKIKKILDKQVEKHAKRCLQFTDEQKALFLEHTTYVDEVACLKRIIQALQIDDITKIGLKQKQVSQSFGSFICFEDKTRFKKFDFSIDHKSSETNTNNIPLLLHCLYHDASKGYTIRKEKTIIDSVEYLLKQFHKSNDRSIILNTTVDSYGCNALAIACMGKYEKVIEYLIKQGADINFAF